MELIDPDILMMSLDYVLENMIIPSLPTTILIAFSYRGNNPLFLVNAHTLHLSALATSKMVIFNLNYESTNIYA